jgi:hypothetical protein
MSSKMFLKHSCLFPSTIQATNLITWFTLHIVHVTYMVGKVALEQVFLQLLLFSPVPTILPLLPINSYIINDTDNGPVSDRNSAQIWTYSSVAVRHYIHTTTDLSVC